MHGMILYRMSHQYFHGYSAPYYVYGTKCMLICVEFDSVDACKQYNLHWSKQSLFAIYIVYHNNNTDS